jgi:integrase
LYKFYNEGVLYRQRGFETQREARQACNAKRLELRDNPGLGLEISFADCATQYLHHHAPPRLAPRTHYKYAHALEVMAERWGKLPLRSLTSHQVEDYCRWRLASPVVTITPQGGSHRRTAGAATVNRDLGALSAMFNWAKAKGRKWVSENPCTEVTRFKEPRIVYQPLTPEDRKAMVEHLGAEAPKVDLLHALGVRISVVLDLRWEQVDFANRTLVYRSKGKDVTRVLGARAAAILYSLNPQASGYVFPARDPSRATFRRHWKKAAKAIGRPGVRPHDLRITFAREMADAGVDTGTIRDMLGHSTTKMTERYIGSSRQAQELATRLHDARQGFA